MISEEQIKRWRGDILAFTEEACIIRRPDGTVGPVQLSDRQKSWLQAIGAREDGRPRYRTVGIVAPKRAGKSIIGGAIPLLWYSLGSDRTSVCLSNSRESAQSLSYDMVKEMLQRGPLGEIAEVKRGEISFPGLNTRIIAVPCNPATVAGIGVTGVLVTDELWQSPDRRAYDLLSSQAEQGQVIMVSQASGGSNPVRQLYDLSQTGDDPTLWFDYVEPAWIKEHVSPNPYLTQGYLDSRRKQIGVDAIFRQYFFNDWGSVSNALVSEAAIRACVEEIPEFGSLGQLQRWLGKEYDLRLVGIGAGLDRAQPFSKHGDRTAWVVTARAELSGSRASTSGRQWAAWISTEVEKQFRQGREPEQVAADLHTMFPQYPERVEQAVASYCQDGEVESFDQAHHFIVDWSVMKHGTEEEVLGAYRNSRRRFGRLNTIVEAYQGADLAPKMNATLEHATAPKQQELFSRLARLIGDQTLHIPARFQELIRELSHFTVDTDSATVPRFGAEGGGHDDTVFGTAWSLEAANSIQGARLVARP